MGSAPAVRLTQAHRVATASVTPIVGALGSVTASKTRQVERNQPYLRGCGRVARVVAAVGRLGSEEVS